MVNTPDDLHLPYQEWKQIYFADMPDEWVMRFWLRYQTEHGGPYQDVEADSAPSMLIAENLSFEAIERAFPELSESRLAYLLQTLSKATRETHFSFADLLRQFPQLSPERLRQLLSLLNRSIEQEAQRLGSSDDPAKDALLEKLVESAEQLDHSQLNEVIQFITAKIK